MDSRIPSFPAITDVCHDVKVLPAIYRTKLSCESTAYLSPHGNCLNFKIKPFSILEDYVGDGLHKRVNSNQGDIG